MQNYCDIVFLSNKIANQNGFLLVFWMAFLDCIITCTLWNIDHDVEFSSREKVATIFVRVAWTRNRRRFFSHAGQQMGSRASWLKTRQFRTWLESGSSSDSLKCRPRLTRAWGHNAWAVRQAGSAGEHPSQFERLRGWAARAQRPSLRTSLNH